MTGHNTPLTFPSTSCVCREEKYDKSFDQWEEFLCLETALSYSVSSCFHVGDMNTKKKLDWSFLLKGTIHPSTMLHSVEGLQRVKLFPVQL